MAYSLGPIGQIALSVADADRSEAFYEGKLGLRKLFRVGTMVFFDCAGVRLLLEQQHDDGPKMGSLVYFRVPDIALARRELEQQGVVFVDKIHMISRQPTHDLWMTFFRDPDEHMHALMSEAPKGWEPT